VASPGSAIGAGATTGGVVVRLAGAFLAGVFFAAGAFFAAGVFFAAVVRAADFFAGAFFVPSVGTLPGSSVVIVSPSSGSVLGRWSSAVSPDR
jgi:hypothetical protein